MSKYFARVTEEHDNLALQVTPCAGLLYRYLLRQAPAGKEQEFEIPDFTDWTGTQRKRPYSLRHAQRTLNELVEVDAIEIIKRYSGTCFKLIAKHPNFDKNVEDLDLNVKSGTEMSKTRASNTDSAVLTDREILKETTDTSLPTRRVRKDINREWINSQSPEIGEDQNPELEHLLKAVRQALAPFEINKQITEVVRRHNLEQVKQAIAALEEAKAISNIKNPTGWLVKAIQKGWKPNKSNSNTHSRHQDERTPPGFSEWFNLARKMNLVTASQQTENGIQVLQGEEWVKWEEINLIFTTRKLEELWSKHPNNPSWNVNPKI